VNFLDDPLVDDGLLFRRDLAEVEWRRKTCRWMIGVGQKRSISLVPGPEFFGAQANASFLGGAPVRYSRATGASLDGSAQLFAQARWPRRRSARSATCTMARSRRAAVPRFAAIAV